MSNLELYKNNASDGDMPKLEKNYYPLNKNKRKNHTNTHRFLILKGKGTSGKANPKLLRRLISSINSN